LATVGCHIDVKNGKLSFDVGNDYVEFNLFNTSKFCFISDECIRLMWLIVWYGKLFLTMILITFLSNVYYVIFCKDENSEVAMCA